MFNKVIFQLEFDSNNIKKKIKLKPIKIELDFDWNNKRTTEKVKKKEKKIEKKNE